MSVATEHGTTLRPARARPTQGSGWPGPCRSPFKGLAVPGPVHAAQHVIQRPVLEYHHDHMIKRVLPAPIRRSRPPIFLARAPGDLRTESGKPPSRRLSLISFRFRVTIATLIGLAGSAAEISALLILYLGH
jgi:hypothetical protein